MTGPLRLCKESWTHWNIVEIIKGIKKGKKGIYSLALLIINNNHIINKILTNNRLPTVCVAYLHDVLLAAIKKRAKSTYVCGLPSAQFFSV